MAKFYKNFFAKFSRGFPYRFLVSGESILSYQRSNPAQEGVDFLYYPIICPFEVNPRPWSTTEG